MTLGKQTLKQKIGLAAEEGARCYLTEQGLKFVARNFRCRVGEIDLVMLDGKVIVFVEVRCRKSQQFGTGLETVGRLKQRKLIRAGMFYLLIHHLSDAPCRFDVVSVDSSQEKILWVKDAFQRPTW